MYFSFSPKTMIPFVVSLAMFMEAVDTSVLNTAIPAMSVSLSVNPIDLKIALISYLLSLAIFIPISGWLADKFGIKRIFTTALIIFILSSFWCGMSRTLPELIIARLLQGVGGSIMLPVGRLIIVRTFKKYELIATMNRVVIIGALGVMLGPVLGGLITHYFSWRWIFWINIPIGLFAILIAQYWLQSDMPRTVHPLDKLGFIYFGLSLAGYTFGMSALSESSISRLSTFGILLISVLLTLAYLVHSRKRTHPIVRTELFHAKTFKVSVVGNLFARIGFGGVPFLMPLLLQIGLGYSAQLSGLLIAPLAIGVLLTKGSSLLLLRFFGFKRLLIWNTLFVAILLWMFVMINANTSLYTIAFFMFIFGIFISLQYTCMNSLAYADVPHEDLSAATSVMSTLQQVSQSLGVAVAALFIRYFTSVSSPSASLTTTVFHETFIAMGILTLFSIIIFIDLQPEDGQGMLVLR